MCPVPPLVPAPVPAPWATTLPLLHTGSALACHTRAVTQEGTLETGFFQAAQHPQIHPVPASYCRVLLRGAAMAVFL